ncbi:SPOR domain-containing protein [Sutcliffiella horikoshii]|uniref:SPOR domain-containing protein n=1 Tax=Sutcliffiella horikoshii TaxID=79883 RepID=UPI00203BC167|nr:SPOR domain-containing protein [Sutcliffiella horikoshii]
MDNHHVKVKINGKETYGKGKKRKRNAKEKLPPQPNNGPIKDDFPEDDLPIIIVDESAAAAEKKEEEFEWVLPKEPLKDTSKSSGDNSYIEDLRQLNKDKGTKVRPAPFGKKKKLAPPSFSKQLLVSIGMAIGIGTCLGFLILGVMNMSGTPVNPEVPTTAPVAIDTTEAPETPAVSGDGSATISAQTLSVLQAGAFSTAEGANAEIDRLRAAGFPAVAVSSDPTFVFMAVGQNVEGMKQIAGGAQAKGFDPYAKEISLSEKTMNSLSEQDVQLLQEGQVLYKQLTVATALLLQGTSLDAAASETLGASFDKVAAIQDSELTDSIKEWKASLSGAYENIRSHQSSNNTEALWDAQQKLLDATKFLY